MAITMDAHNDTLMKVIHPDSWRYQTSLNSSTPFNIDAPKMISGEVNAAFFAAFTDDMGSSDLNNSRLAALMLALDSIVSEPGALLKKAYNTDQIETFMSSGHRIAIQTIEGGYGITAENAKRLLIQYADMGVKAITLVWDHSNALGEGTKACFANGTPSETGLTALGHETIAQMESLGILVDVSHMNEATFYDTLKHATSPVIASHSGAYAIKEHVRNLTDDQLKAIAKNGGVAHVVFCRFFIGDEHSGLDTLVKHILHMVSVAGEDHVGLGSDFDGATMPVDLLDISRVNALSTALKENGFADSTIAKIMGENTLRVLKANDRKRSCILTHTFENMILGDNTLVKIALPVAPLNEAFEFWLNGIRYKATYDSSQQILHSTVPGTLKEFYYFASFTNAQHTWRATGILSTRG